MDMSLLRNEQEDLMLTVLALVFLLIVFDIAAMRWGFNSSDGPDSEEWERRRQHAWLRKRSQTHLARRTAKQHQVDNSETCPNFG